MKDSKEPAIGNKSHKFDSIEVERDEITSKVQQKMISTVKQISRNSSSKYLSWYQLKHVRKFLVVFPQGRRVVWIVVFFLIKQSTWKIVFWWNNFVYKHDKIKVSWELSKEQMQENYSNIAVVLKTTEFAIIVSRKFFLLTMHDASHNLNSHSSKASASSFCNCKTFHLRLLVKLSFRTTRRLPSKLLPSK